MTRVEDSRSGYALPVVLGVVAVLALVFASAASALAALATAARGAVDGAEFQARALSAEAEAEFHVATAPFAPDGLRVGAFSSGQSPSARARLRTDGRGYGWGAPALGLRASLQDEAGLVNLDASRPDALLRLFAGLGLSGEEARTLTDRLLDALDRDDDRRPRGAETADYLARGLQPPLPGGFRSLAEVNAVMDWPQVLAGPRRRGLEALATADPSGATFNVNTAPPAVLGVVLNLAPEQTARIVAARERAPLSSLTAAGLPAGEAQSGVRPNGRLRFVFTDARRGLRYTSRIVPGADPASAPWAARSAAFSRSEPSPPRTDPADVARFPDPADPAAAR